MDPWRVFEKLRPYGDILTWFVGVWKQLLTVVAGLVILWSWGTAGGFAWLRAHALPIWLILISAAVFFVCLWAYRLRGQLQTGFRDKFQGDLSAKWDFRGEWRIPEKGTLLVTGGEIQPGKYVDGVGVTKVGAQWENYTFSFRARIVNRCLGVVVRAQDMRNFYMMQIAPTYVTPHRQVTVPVISSQPRRKFPPVAAAIQPAAPPGSHDSTDLQPEDAPSPPQPRLPARGDSSDQDGARTDERSLGPEERSLQAGDEPARPSNQAASNAVAPQAAGPSEPRLQVDLIPGWVFTPETPLAAPLTDWFDAKVTVRGQSIALYINGELVLHKDSYLQNPVGKVGFRNWGPEEAFVRDVRVRLER
jgi:hypothetical protein